jgi:hypothetical protein
MIDSTNFKLTYDAATVEKLLDDVYEYLDYYYRKYRHHDYKDKFFSDKDYEFILKLLEKASVFKTYLEKFFKYQIEDFVTILPYDLRWKVPASRDRNPNNVPDMTMLCDDVQDLYDWINQVYEYYRDPTNTNKKLSKKAVKALKDDLFHIKAITEYGVETYGLDWGDLDFKIPSDILAKIPPHLRGN